MRFARAAFLAIAITAFCVRLVVMVHLHALRLRMDAFCILMQAIVSYLLNWPTVWMMEEQLKHSFYRTVKSTP